MDIINNISNEELEKVLKAYNKDKSLQEKKFTMSYRTAKYVAAGILVVGAIAARQFLSIGRA